MTSYRQIIAAALAHESKDHRDQVLAEFDPVTQSLVRSQLQGIARRLATWIRYAGHGDAKLSSNDRRILRRQRLASIEPQWLADRVARMVREQFVSSKEGEAA